MALPAGVTTATVVAGVPVSFVGSSVKAFVSIEPSVFLVHAATGTPIVDFLEESATVEGVSVQFTLPHTDQAGFIDENGNAYTNWYYTARITYSTPSKAKDKAPKLKVFQLTTGQTTVDLDLLPGGAPALPYIAPSATVNAFHGRTGPVTLQESDLPDRLDVAELNATYAGTKTLGLDDGQISPKALMRKGDSPQILSLITGTEDEALAVSQCTVTADTVNFKLGGRGWKLTTAGAVTNAYALLSPIPPAVSGLLTIRPAQAVCLWVYVEDATKMTNVQVEITQDAGNTISWLRANTAAPAQPLVNGWNLLRWKMAEGLPVTFTGTTANRVRVFLTTNAATSISIGHLYLETPPKARMIFVADRGYKSFVVNGLPALREAGVPVTWALDILKLGDHAGEYPNGALPYAEAINEADVAQYAAEGDSISFHGFTSDPTSAMSVGDIRKDTVQCLKWLQARGYRGRMWRAAWVQNTAVNHAAADPYLIGQATWDVNTHSVALDCWPPRDMQNIARWDFYTKTDDLINTQFDILKRTHSTMVVYNHGVGTGYSGDATQAKFDLFMSNVNTGINEGWLEATTFEALFAESGGTFQTLNGASVATYTDRDGARVTKTAL